MEFKFHFGNTLKFQLKRFHDFEKTFSFSYIISAFVIEMEYTETKFHTTIQFNLKSKP